MSLTRAVKLYDRAGISTIFLISLNPQRWKG